MDKYENATVLECVMSENRQLHAVLDQLKKVLQSYPDLEHLSLLGAAAYLIRHRKLVDDIKHELRRVDKNPDKAPVVLERIQRLLEDAK